MSADIKPLLPWEDYSGALSLEEKLILSGEEPIKAYLEDQDIKEIVEKSLSSLPFDFQEKEVEILYDAFYDAILEAVERMKP